MAKIAVTMIARDEEGTLRACLESLAPHVDELIFVDTGSTDKTVAIAREFTDKVFHFDWINDFAAARQFALEQVSEDMDWIAWADGDDVVEGAANWRTMADNAPEHSQGFVFPYNYATDTSTGTVTTRLYRERLLRGPASRWQWSGAVHEVLGLKDGTTPHLTVTDECVYVHDRPDQKYLPDRNLRIIQDYIRRMDDAGQEPDPRMVIYLGSELMAHARWAEAVPAFLRYIAVSQWDEEKYQAHHKMADCYRQMGMHHDAIATELRALAIRDDWPDSYYGLAECYYHLQDWDKCLSWTERGDKIGPPRTLLITHPLDYSFLPKVYLSVALFHKGNIERALEVVEEALAVMPQDAKLQHNRDVFSETLRSRKTIDAALLLSSELVVHDEPLVAMSVLDSVPHTMRFDPRVIDARARTRRLTEHLYDPVAYTALYEGNDRMPRAEATADVDPFSFPRFRALVADLSKLEPVNEEQVTVLEVGCNDGVMACALAKLGYKVIAADLNDKALDVARARAAHMGVEDNIEFVHGDTEDVLEWDLDAAFAFEVIEHVPDHLAFLRQLDQHVRDGGIVAVSTPDGVYDRDFTTSLALQPHREHVRVLPRQELTDLIYTLDLGVIRQNLRTEDRLSYVSYMRCQTPERDVTIWCPFSYEAWSPDSLDAGIGGSEEAVIHMARELTAKGHRVTVYGGAEGAWDGVLYHNYNQFDPYEKRDIVVLWRTPTPVDFRLNAEQVYVWMHDVPNAAEFTPERLERINQVWVLSDWHRACLPNVPDEKIEVIRNGVTPPEQQTDTERDPLKVVWGSSPDRGLDKLMAVWSDVAAAVPGATLHCYYGFDMYDKMGRPPAFKNQVMQLVEQNRDTVTWHGRVGQQELWDAFVTSGVWAYPTYFDEISCITAMRAQMAGAWPVVVPQAALAETVRWGDKVDHDIQTDAGLLAFRDALINALRNPINDDTRKAMQSDTGEFYTWSAVADLWRTRFAAKGEADTSVVIA